MELVAMVYSLIRQLVGILPYEGPKDSMCLQTAAWAELDGTMDTFSQALRLLEALLCSTGHAIVVLVIDGIECLDDRTHKSTEKCLRDVVELLKRLVSAEQSTIMKVWFASTGNSPVLFGALDVKQIVISSPTRRRGGSLLDSELIMV